MKRVSGRALKSQDFDAKSFPAGAAWPVQQFPIGEFAKAPFGLKHDLGEVLTPAKMAQSVPFGASPVEIAKNADKVLAALVGCGPRQMPAHLGTLVALENGLARLRDHALAGDEDALHAFGWLISKSVADLREIAHRKPRIVTRWSSKQNVVPVLAGRNLAHRKQLEADLNAFAVGEASPYRVNPPRGKKAPDVSMVANALAGDLCAHLAEVRAKYLVFKKPCPNWAKMAAKLPELSLETWECWANAAWECLQAASRGRPEAVSVLRDLGRKAAKRDGLLKAGTVAANVRAEIRQTLREAIRGLASRRPFRIST